MIPLSRRLLVAQNAAESWPPLPAPVDIGRAQDAHAPQQLTAASQSRQLFEHVLATLVLAHSPSVQKKSIYLQKRNYRYCLMNSV
jgi:hypothetical protein